MDKPTELQQEAQNAFERDLPALWAERAGQWVACHRNQRLGFAPHKHLLYQQCLKEGRQLNDFVVFCIQPQETEMLIG